MNKVFFSLITCLLLQMYNHQSICSHDGEIGELVDFINAKTDQDPTYVCVPRSLLIEGCRFYRKVGNNYICGV